MARPNYGFQKRQKQIAKQKKKEAKRLRKLEGASEPSDELAESPEELDAAQARKLAETVDEVKQGMSDLPEGSAVYQLGADLLMNLHARTTEESLELAEGFLEQARQQK